MCSRIAAVERANIHHELIGLGSEQKRLHSDEKRMNYPAIKHEEMLSAVAHGSGLMVPAGVRPHDTRNQAALSQPSATIAPQCCAYVYRERHAAAISSKRVNRMPLSHCASQMIDNERLAH
ncbi:hypothetical protein EYF80_034431 [Liparis tanakae]|uniref:Uncharacterized protein n=1 Tax=Liparis tanakae TaxID=230148 RepID=A0A4Z2GNY8_9TELE|nr:hypothetical protein EYF80_034431 [Liparis tanakae]